MKSIMMVVAAVAVQIAAASGIVQNVPMRQLRPWNGLVEIGYEPAEDAVREGKVSSLRVMVNDHEHATNYQAKTFTTDPVFTAGSHRLVWNAKADGIAFVSTNVSCTVGITCAPPPPPPLYCVIDLAGGTAAENYPVNYLSQVPGGGWTDEHKTTKLVLRKIEPGTFTMGDQVHGGSTYANITISKPFWIGIFQVTQKQYKLVTGADPSSYKGDMRPVECVSWNTITGSDGFIARIAAKSGLVCSLPTEAQWEYACRAGTTTDYNNGTNYSNGGQDANMAVVGRYNYNQSDGKGGCSSGHTTVGSYVPNDRGLYDMHGNVWEWCLDWFGSLSSGATDPSGPASGSDRVLRGGSWDNDALNCTSSYRYYYYPSIECNYYGFRLACSAGSSDR